MMENNKKISQIWYTHLLKGVWNYLPGIQALLHYERRWLRFDILAGLSVCAILIPQGMAYGSLAGTEPVSGFYTAMVAMIAYAIFSTSRHMMVGPEAGSAIIAAGIIAPFAARDPLHYAVLMAALALLTGLLLVLAGIVKLGFIRDFLSKPVLVGYMNAIALTMIAGQMGKLLNIKLESSMFFPQVWEMLTRFSETSMPTLVMGACLLGLLFFMRFKFPRVPAYLVVVILSIVVTAVFKLDQRGISIVGDIPTGLPSFQIPFISMDDIQLLVPGALTLAVLILSDGLLTVQVYADKNKYSINADQELIAFGINNIASSLFHGFPAAASESRSSVNNEAHGRTQVSALVAAAFLVIVLLWLTPLLHFLPTVALGAIVIAAASNLIDFRAVGRLGAVRLSDAALALITTLGVLVIGMLPGIIIAIVFSLLHVIALISRPHDAILGRAQGVDGYHDIETNEDCETVPGLIVYRFESQLIFANSSYFRTRVQNLIAAQKETVNCLIIDAESMQRADITAAEMLRLLCPWLREQGVELAFARTNSNVRSFFHKTGIMQLIGPDRFFPTVRTAVDAFSGGTLTGPINYEA
jgi:SulP family sulfate permease